MNNFRSIIFSIVLILGVIGNSLHVHQTVQAAQATPTPILPVDCSTSQADNIVVTDTSVVPNQQLDSYLACTCFVTLTDSATNMTCGQNPTPTPTPLPTATPTPTATPSPTPSATPTPTPVPVLITVTFDPSPGTCCQLNGIYQGINWGTNQWAWEGAFFGFKTNNIFFNNQTGQSRSISFVNPHILVQMDLLTDLAGTLTITDNNGQTATTSVTSTNPVTFKTGWNVQSNTVTFKFVTSDGAGWHIDFDNIVYQ